MLTILLLGMLMTKPQSAEVIKLPPPHLRGEVALEAALANRRSVRDFSQSPLSMEEIGQLLWAAQGITEQTAGLRTAPSAGALYPLEIHAVLPSGIFRYEPRGHQMRRIIDNDQRRQLSHAAQEQQCVSQAGAVFVIAGVYERTTGKYGERGRRFVFFEAGHVAQNLLLQATALGLGAVPVGAFHDEDVEKLLRLPKHQAALYLIAVGKPIRK